MIITRNSAISRLRTLGLITIIIAIVSIYLQGTATIQNTDIYGLTNLSETDLLIYTTLRLLSYLILLLFIISGGFLIAVRSIASKLLLISSVLSFIMFSLPIIFFLTPGFSSLSVDTTFKMKQLSAFAASGHTLFGVSFYPLWAPPLAFKCFRFLSSDDYKKDNNDNDSAFNKSIETDRE